MRVGGAPRGSLPSPPTRGGEPGEGSEGHDVGALFVVTACAVLRSNSPGIPAWPRQHICGTMSTLPLPEY